MSNTVQLTLSEEQKLAMSIALAGLHSGETQENIAKSLGMKQPKICALSKLGMKLLKVSLPDNLEEAEKYEIERQFYVEAAEELKTTLKGLRTTAQNKLRPLEVCIYYSGDEPKQRVKRFGRAAARRVVALLRTSNCTAVAWGRTVISVVEGIEAARPKPHKKLRLLPSSGEPVGHVVEDHSASAAVSRLAELLHCEDFRSLRGVPLRIPKSMNGDSNAIRKFVNRSRDYQRIFGSSKPEIESVDTILSGVGDADSSVNDPWFKETVEAESVRNLQKIAVGNIGGIWLPRDKKNSKQQQLINDMNSRWLGIQKRHIERCAESASTVKPGVIVIAAGLEKAAVIRSTIDDVNHLLIDDTLATELVGHPLCKPHK